jgi:hypothetical protein
VDANLPIEGSQYRAADIADKNSVCRWNTDMYGIDVKKPGGQDYYDSILRLYASWGVDFIKADNMLDGYHIEEIKALSAAIGKTKRPIVLSLSPGASLKTANPEELAKYAQMWRISGDFWDRWRDLRRQFDLFRDWIKYSRPGGWSDGDMLPLGHIGIRAERGDPRMSLLTKDEQITLMTLWSMGRSPLMFGGHLPDNDDFTLSLLTNDEVLRVNQRATASRELFLRGNQAAWTAEIAGAKTKYVALFNIGDNAEESVRVNWTDLGLPARCRVRDLWTRKDLGAISDGHSVTLKPHAAAMFRVEP